MLKSVNNCIEFAKPENSFELDALEHFRNLKPEARTELLGQMYERYSIWYNDQQKALQMAAGDYE